MAWRMHRWQGAWGRAFAPGGIQRCLRARHVIQARLALATLRSAALLASVLPLLSRLLYTAAKSKC